MNLNLGIQPWAFEKPNPLEVRRTSYTTVKGKDGDVDYIKMRKSNIRPVYPPQIGTVPANTRGLILENPPAKSLIDFKREQTDKDYSEMMSRNSKYSAVYPIVDKDHSKKVMASGSGVDDNVVNIPPTIEEMFSIVLQYKKDINESDYNYWLSLEQQYKKLKLLEKIRPLTDVEKDTIEKIRLLLIKELEKDTKEKKNSTSFNEILNLLNSIITRGGVIYSTAKIAEILNSLSNFELGEIKQTVENITLEDLSDINKLALTIFKLNKEQSELILTELKGLPNPLSIDLPTPQIAPPDETPVQSPSDFITPAQSPVNVLSELINSVSSVGKTISQVGLQEPVKDILKTIGDADFQIIKTTLGLPDSLSRKNLYNSIINIDLTDIYQSLSNIATSNPVSLAGVAGLITEAVKRGGLSKTPEIAANLQNVIGLLPAPELLKVIQVVGLPATSSASAIMPLLSTLGQSALWGLAISLIMSSLYKEKSPAEIKKQFGDKLMPLDYDQTKPNVMIKKSDQPFATVQDVGFQSGQVLDPSSSWAIQGADPVYIDNRPLPDLTDVSYEDYDDDQSPGYLQPTIPTTPSSPLLMLNIKKVFANLNTWGKYQNENKKRAYDLSRAKLIKILNILGLDINYRDRVVIINKIIETINTNINSSDEEVSKKAKAVKKSLLTGSINRMTTLDGISNIIREEARTEITAVSSDEDEPEEQKEGEISGEDNKTYSLRVLDELILDKELSPTQKVLKALFTKLNIIKPSPLTIGAMLKILKKYLNDSLLTDPHKIKQRNQLIQLIADNGFNSSTTEIGLNVIDNKRGMSSTHGTLKY